MWKAEPKVPSHLGSGEGRSCVRQQANIQSRYLELLIYKNKYVNKFKRGYSSILLKGMSFRIMQGGMGRTL